MRYGVKELENNDGGPAGAIAPRDIIAPPPQLIGTTEPVELEDAKEELEPWITEEGLQRFLAIVGFRGLGKTTLAMELYREFGEKFECRAFVLASQKFHLPTVLRSSLVLPRMTLSGSRIGAKRT
jgi:disease resistance protein RPM1